MKNTDKTKLMKISKRKHQNPKTPKPQNPVGVGYGIKFCQFVLGCFIAMN